MPMTLREILRSLLRPILGTTLACWLLLGAQTAFAACALTNAVTGDLGSRTSYDIRSGGASPVSVPPQLTCNGSLLSLVSTDYVTATTTSTNVFRLRASSGETIGYRLSADSGGTQTFTQGGTIDYMASTTIGLLGALSSSSQTPPMFVALTETPNVAAGTYTDTVSVAWSWAICRGIGFGGLCVLQERGSGTTTLSVTVTVTRDCRITAPPVTFDPAPLASRFTAVTQAVSVDCTKGSTFSIAFSSGTGGASRPWRQMKDTGGHVLRYNIYWPDGTTIWDASSARAGAGPGTGASVPTLLHTYVARIDPGQATPPPGSYSDTVSVVVTF